MFFVSIKKERDKFKNRQNADKLGIKSISVADEEVLMMDEEERIWPTFN
jgi:glutaredoxin-related protein